MEAEVEEDELDEEDEEEEEDHFILCVRVQDQKNEGEVPKGFEELVRDRGLRLYLSFILKNSN